MTRGLFAAGLWVLAGCATSLRAADLLPENGLYEWGKTNHPAQKMFVISNGESAALVHLKLGEASSPSCTRNGTSDSKACAEVLWGRHLATVFEMKADGIHELEQGDLVVPIVPKVGMTWTLGQTDSSCSLARAIRSVDKDTVTIEMLLRCTDKPDEVVLVERWSRGLGRAEVDTKSGAKIAMKRVVSGP